MNKSNIDAKKTKREVDLMIIYEEILMHCKELNVPVVKYKYKNELSSSTLLAELVINNGKPKLYIKNGLVGLTLSFAIAHEIRHWYQYCYQRSMFDNYVTRLSSNLEKYNEQDMEVDANAYALLFMKTFYGVSPTNIFDNFGEKAKRLTLNRIEELNNQMLKRRS